MATTMSSTSGAALGAENALALVQHTGALAGPYAEAPEAVMPMVGSRPWPNCERCGLQCTRLTSHTPQNPMRVFFKCPMSGENESMLNPHRWVWEDRYKAGEDQSGPYRSRANDTCFRCGQLGHWASQCDAPRYGYIPFFGFAQLDVDAVLGGSSDDDEVSTVVLPPPTPARAEARAATSAISSLSIA